MNGIINVLKPPGMSSHDVVNFMRKTLGTKKVGHTGTLDPNAAGVLVICIGKGTKVIEYLMDDSKSYRTELSLGASTDTQDRYGEVIHQSTERVSNEDIRMCFKNYEGKLQQLPPMFSALKHKGKKLYELAREGKEIKRDPRDIMIYDLDIIKIDQQQRILFDITCSKGTYVRTICHDIGWDLGTYGYMSFLLRTRVGIFNLQSANTLEEIKRLQNLGQVDQITYPIDYPLEYLSSVLVKDNLFSKVINGGRIDIIHLEFEKKSKQLSTKLKVYCKAHFIGIGYIISKDGDKYLKMEKVLYQR